MEFKDSDKLRYSIYESNAKAPCYFCGKLTKFVNKHLEDRICSIECIKIFYEPLIKLLEGGEKDEKLDL